MQQQKHVLSCDWGTSFLRLQLIDKESQTSLAKVSSDHGNAALFNQWKAQPGTDRIQFYLEHLHDLINKLTASTSIPVTDVCILISGMASSSIGIKELPYANLPFSLDGSSAYSEWLEATPILNNPILLISGVQQSDDVMRGEETQLIGIASLLELPAEDKSLFILPGTHSKHVVVNNNRIEYFNTFMTGEVFELLTKHSILSHAVIDPKSTELTNEEKKSFCDGVNKAMKSELMNAIFSVRINQLKKYLSPQQNYFYLSGLLIGSEIKYIRENNTHKLVLCSSGTLQQLYKLAIDCADLSDRTIIVSPEILDNAAATGQLKILINTTSKII